MVYLIQAIDGGPVKIGFSEDLVGVSKRLESLQTGNPRKLRVVQTLNGGRDLEKRLHREFAYLRITKRGEWFHVDDILQSLIDGHWLPDIDGGYHLTGEPVEIKWRCDRCDKPVTRGRGFVGVELHDLRRAKQEAIDHHRRIDATAQLVPVGGPRSKSWAAIVEDSPRPAAWRCLHDSCPKTGEVFDYWWPITEISSYRDALNWTCHMYLRDEFVYSDWVQFIRRHCNQFLEDR